MEMRSSAPSSSLRRKLIVAAAGAGAVAASVAVAPPASAATFGAGNVVVCRVGDGSSALSNASTAAFVDEYTPAGALVQSIALPVATVGVDKPLTLSGTANSECLITRSDDGQYLVLTGYSATPGTASIAGTASATVPRTIGRISAAGAVDTSTALTDLSTGNNPRSVATVDGSVFWAAGGAGGVRYATLGATTSTQLSTTLTNLRQVSIAGGQLFTSTGSGSTIRVGTVGSGLPTVAGQTITNLPGFPTTGSPYAYSFADLDAGVPGNDTLYVADDSSGSGVQKFSLVGGNWVANGTVAIAAARGLTAAVMGNAVTLYVTSNAGTLQKLTDTSGYNAPNNGVPATIATAVTNTAMRGVALAPFETPAPVVPEVPFAIMIPASMLAVAAGFVATRHRPRLRVSA